MRWPDDKSPAPLHAKNGNRAGGIDCYPENNTQPTAEFQDWRLSFYERAEAALGRQKAFFEYIREHGIDLAAITAASGFCCVLDVIDCGNRRFEFFDNHQDAFPAFICECIEKDSEATILDLVAWPLDRSDHCMTLNGRAGLLGLWQANGIASYFMGRALPMYRTPLEWLQSGCDGAVVVDQRIASLQVLDLPGKIEARDVAHGFQLQRMLTRQLVNGRVVVASRKLEAAE